MPARALAAAPAFVLPVLFLGYAVVANYEFANGLGRDIEEMPKSASAYLNGEAALQIDSYYKKIMPHRLPSIDLMGAARYLTFREGRPGVVVGEDGWLFSKEEFEAPIKRSADLGEAISGIAAIHDRLAAQGVDLVIVPLAAKADIYSEHLADQTVSQLLAGLYTEFRQRLAEAGVRTVDTRETLLEAKQAGPVFLERDTHWTPLGAAAVAGAVGAALGRDETEYRLADGAPVARDGDLAKFIVTGALSEAVGLGAETIVPRQAVALETAAASTDIFGSDSAIRFALTGTSYSANDQWSFAENLKAALGADVLNVAEEGLGPVAPMRKYLASDTLRDTPPEVVIWEFPVRYLGNPQLWDEPVATSNEG